MRKEERARARYRKNGLRSTACLALLLTAQIVMTELAALQEFKNKDVERRC